MSEVGIDLSGRRPRGSRRWRARPAWARSPSLWALRRPAPCRSRSIEWDLRDPHEMPLADVREIRNEIEARIEQLVVDLTSPRMAVFARFEALVADAIDALPRPNFKRSLRAWRWSSTMRAVMHTPTVSTSGTEWRGSI